MSSHKHWNRCQSWQGLLCWLSWLLFAAGLSIQMLAPRLEVSNGAFVIPSVLTSGGNDIYPDEIIRTERRMQLMSAVLTVGGAIGLAFRYRDVLVGGFSRRSVTNRLRDQPDVIPPPRSASRPDKKEKITQKEEVILCL
jgi:hypothetical protein